MRGVSVRIRLSASGSSSRGGSEIPIVLPRQLRKYVITIMEEELFDA